MKSRVVYSMVTTVAIVLFIVTDLRAQDYWSKRYDLDRGNDYGTQIIAVDSGFLVMVKALCEINNRQCEGFIKINEDGELDWKAIVYDSINANYFDAIALRDDSIYVNMNYIGINDKNYTILSYDFSGNIGPRHDYFHTGINGQHWARDITGYADRLFVSFRYKDNITNTQVHSIRTYDRFWELLWEIDLPNTAPFITWCDTEAADDGGLVVIYHSYGNMGALGIATIEKYDAVGEMEWQTILPHAYSVYGDWVRIDTHIDGGYVGFWAIDSFGLNINEFPWIVFKLDSLGELEWERVYWDEETRLWNVFSTKNGDIVGCGIAYDWPWVHDSIEYEAGFIVRFNAEGERLWDRKIIEMTDGAYDFDLLAGDEAPNGDLIFTGGIYDSIYGTHEDATPENVWVVKVDSMGCFEPGCGEFQHVITGLQPTPLRDEPGFIAFPNPASDVLMLGARLGAHIARGDYEAVLYDSQGRKLNRRAFNPDRITEIDISGLPPGVYPLVILRDMRHVQTLQCLLY